LFVLPMALLLLLLLLTLLKAKVVVWLKRIASKGTTTDRFVISVVVLEL